MSRRPVLLTLAAVVLLAAGAAVVWPNATPDVVVAKPPPPAPRDFGRIEVQAAPTEQALTLTGVVRDAAGRVVPGAEVSLASSAQAALTTARCGVCGEPLLACEARETAIEIESLLEAGSGLLQPAATARTDAEGKFRFERLKGVSFTVWARAEGLGEAVRERAAPGEPVELFLPALRSIAGRVIDAEGQGISGATVHAVSLRLPLEHHAQSGDDGRFELTGLGEGPFFVLAEKKGHLPDSKGRVEAGPQPLTLTLQPPRVLEVSVTRGGAPADALVRVEADHLLREARTEKGQLRVEGLFPDGVTVMAREGELSSPSHPLTLSARVTRVTLELDEGGRLSVTPVDSDGNPVPNPTLELMTASGTRVEKRVAKTGELVQFGPLSPGEYFVSGEAEGFKPQLLPVKLAAKELSLEMVMERGTLIRGRVLDEYGRPADGVSVLVGPTGDVVFADEAGRFSILVPTPGLYTLHAHHSDWGGGEVKVNAPADDVVLSLEPKGGVRITVTSNGRRVEGADAMLWLEKNDVFRSDRPSSADGVVLMRGMPPGQYWLRASHPDFIPSERQKVDVRDGELLDVTAELREGASLRGVVVDEKGMPLPDVSVGLIPRGATPQLTNGRGEFEFRALWPKTQFRVEARHDRYEQQAPVEARPGGEPLRVVMTALAVFRGRVLGEGGVPLKRFRIDENEVVSADGRFELPLSSTGDLVVFGVEASGYEPLAVERPAAPDVGDVQLERAPEVSGRVLDERGGPVSEAVVGCDFCDESVLTDQEGRYTISVPRSVILVTIVAKKGQQTGSVKATHDAPAPDLRLEASVRLSGVAYLSNGKPAAGSEIGFAGDDLVEPVTVVTDAKGAYSIDLSPGQYRVALESRQETERAVWLMVEVRGPSQVLDLGPAPGTHTLTVQIPPTSALSLWVARGVPSISSPPLELLSASYVQVLMQPKPGPAKIHGLLPGDYLLVLTNMQEEGTAAQKVVRVPSSGVVALP